ncbi:MAG: Maf-like protein [Paludibacteraceae bacterium]
MNLVLGSRSPRRRELLAGLDVPFEVADIDCDESFPAVLQAGDIPAYIARRKAEAYFPQLQAGDVLLTADTIVWVDGRMLGKPHDAADARRMLRLLSGKTHQVFTAVCLTTLERQETVVDTTDVTFKQLTDAEIDYYIDRYHPFDKAGAYGIQEWIGYVGVTAVSGSYFNVMGFPVHRVAALLQPFSFPR